MGNRLSPRRRGQMLTHPSYISVAEFRDDDDNLVPCQSMYEMHTEDRSVDVARRCESARSSSTAPIPIDSDRQKMTTSVETTKGSEEKTPPSLSTPYDDSLGYYYPPTDTSSNRAARRTILNRLTPETRETAFWRISLRDSSSDTRVY